jgi:hypothetical protein
VASAWIVVLIFPFSQIEYRRQKFDLTEKAMLLKQALTALVLVHSLATAIPSFSQAQPAGETSGIPQLPLLVGVGFSNFNLDYGGGRRMNGIEAFADYYFYYAPSFLRLTGIEVEGRDIDFGRPQSLLKMRQDTLQGGPVVTLFNRRKVRLYAKALAGFGSIDSPSNSGKTHTTDLLYSVGGGVDYRATRSIWIRGDYEGQWWPAIFSSGTALTPGGFSIGVSYTLKGVQSH